MPRVALGMTALFSGGMIALSVAVAWVIEYYLLGDQRRTSRPAWSSVILLTVKITAAWVFVCVLAFGTVVWTGTLLPAHNLTVAFLSLLLAGAVCMARIFETNTIASLRDLPAADAESLVALWSGHRLWWLGMLAVSMFVGAVIWVLLAKVNLSQFMRISGTVLVLLLFLTKGSLWLLKEGESLDQEQTAKERAVKAAYTARTSLREAVREYAYELEDEYEWLLEMPEEEQQAWANRTGRFQEIIEDWRKDKARFNALRKKDEFELVLVDMGTLGEHMLRIWKARMALLRYARGYSRRHQRMAMDAAEELECVRVERDIDDLFARLKQRTGTKG